VTAPTAAPPRPVAPARPVVSARPVAPARSELPEVALVLLTVAAAVDLSRLFHHRPTFLGPVLLSALAVHLVCWSCRRARLGLAPAAAGSVVAVALLISWTVFPHHLALLIPWRATLHDVRRAMSTAADQFRTAAPPTLVVPGFTLAGAVGCSAAAFLADWAAFRMRATVEACLPSLSVFVFSAALAQGHGAVLAAGVWLAAALFFLLVREAGLERPGPAWFASRAGGGPGAILQAGALIGAVALVLGLVVGPHLPGATTHGLISWRHHPGGSGGRTTGSPLVDIRSRLTDLSQIEAFTVKANSPEYWRLTSLDTFDGNGWSLNDTYRHTSGPLIPASGTPARAVTAAFNVSTLDSIWLPAAYRPVRYSGPGKVSYSSDAGSLIADKATSNGLTYTVQSSVLTPDVATLEASPPVTDPSLARYLQLPSMPPLVAAIAHEVTSGARTPYEMARRLQDYFRSPAFTYDLSVPAYDGTNAIVQFLEQRRGFCQQFAATYAAMARLLGLPTRVAVGFTQGNPGDDGRFHVVDADAHAWPEVYFSGVGWVAFEPTPGRGAPDAQAYTGVTPQQAGTGEANSTTTTPATPTTVAGASGAGAAQPSHFLVDAPTTVTAGKPFSVTVTAKDTHNHTLGGYAGAVTLSSSDVKAVFGANPHPLAAGVYTFSAVALHSLGQQTLTASAGDVSSSAGTITVRRGTQRSLGLLLLEILLWCSPLILLSALPLLGAVRRARRRAAAKTPEAKVLLAWRETGEELALVGAGPAVSDTPTEYARRAAHRLPLSPSAKAALGSLAEQVVEVSYAPEPSAGSADPARADADRLTVTEAAARLRGRWQRLVDVNRRALRR
jgi:transglutaminase-like putative cysteine protease